MKNYSVKKDAKMRIKIRPLPTEESFQIFIQTCALLHIVNGDILG